MNDTFFTNGFTFFLISSIVTLLMAIVADLICKTLTRRFNEKHKDKITTNQYLYLTIRTIVWLVCITIIIKQIKPLSSLGDTILGATSIVAVAVGIAAQTTFGNYIAGFFLAIHQPFKVGDIIFIKERGLSGTVQEINFRHTVLLTQEHTEIIIPNTIMNTAVIEDMSSGNYSELIELKLMGNTDLNKVQKIIDDILDKEELVNQGKDTKLVIKSIDKNGYLAAFPIHTKTLQDFGEVRNRVLPEIYKALKKHKIEMY